MASSPLFLLTFLVCSGLLQDINIFCRADPTDGFTAVQMNEADFMKQQPYDVALGERYSFIDGVRSLWVYSSDKPFKQSSPTKPRTEISLIKHSYTSGVWQFEGHAYVPSGTTGVSIMQVFGAAETATTLMLHVYDGALMYYRKLMVVDDVYGRWLRVNVIHDVGAAKLQVYIDGVQKLVVDGRGGDRHYFKFGVYEQQESSSCMESRWKDVKILNSICE